MTCFSSLISFSPIISIKCGAPEERPAPPRSCELRLSTAQIRWFELDSVNQSTTGWRPTECHVTEHSEIQKSATSGGDATAGPVTRPVLSCLTRPSSQVTRSLTHESGLAATHIALLFFLLSRLVAGRSHRSDHAPSLQFASVSRFISFWSHLLSHFGSRARLRVTVR